MRNFQCDNNKNIVIPDPLIERFNYINLLPNIYYYRGVSRTITQYSKHYGGELYQWERWHFYTKILFSKDIFTIKSVSVVIRIFAYP